MLVFGCFFLMGSYYCYDNPAALSTYLEDSTNTWYLSTKQVAVFYSVYSLPNVVLPLFGGILLDKIGIK
jgi:MFS family permease